MKIKLGAIYRHRNSPSSWYAKARKILPARSKDNPNTYMLVQVEWSSDKSFMFGLIKYFRVHDLMLVEEKP